MSSSDSDWDDNVDIPSIFNPPSSQNLSRRHPVQQPKRSETIDVTTGVAGRSGVQQQGVVQGSVGMRTRTRSSSFSGVVTGTTMTTTTTKDSGNQKLGPPISTVSTQDKNIITSSSSRTRTPCPSPSSTQRNDVRPSAVGDSKDEKAELTRSIPVPSDELPSELLTNLRRWILGLGIVNFDLDLGPDLDNIYPPFPLSPSESSTIAFSSFPDSNARPTSHQTVPTQKSPDRWTKVFSWRFPRGGRRSICEKEGTAKVPEGDGHLYGYCWFLQEKNATIRRGYIQRAIVIITHLPDLPNLFKTMISSLGPLYTKSSEISGGEGGSACLEAACRDVARWPPPERGTDLELAFLGTAYTFEIPLRNQPQYRHNYNLSNHAAQVGGIGAGNTDRGRRRSRPDAIPATVPSTSLTSIIFPPPSRSHSQPPNRLTPTTKPTTAMDPTRPSSPSPITTMSTPFMSFSNLLVLWELVILGEPVFVYCSGDTGRVADVVEWLSCFIRPIPFAGDWRPHFQIQCIDFPLLINSARPRPGIILGATNPFILQNCQHWPHVLRVPNPPQSDPNLPPPPVVSENAEKTQNGKNPNDNLTPSSSPVLRSLSDSSMVSPPPKPPPKPHHILSSGSRGKSPLSHGGSGGVGGGGNGRKDEEKEGLQLGLRTNWKRHVKKDKEVWNEVLGFVQRGDHLSADAVLLKHLSIMTERFLVPLNRYFSTLMPNDTSLSNPQKPSSFNQIRFIQSLKSHGSPLAFRRSTKAISISSMTISSPSSTISSLGVSFYERFLKSPNFGTWLHERMDAIERESRKRYLDRLENGDVEKWWKEGKNEGEVKDLIGRLEDEMRISEESTSPPSTTPRSNRPALLDVAPPITNLRKHHPEEEPSTARGNKLKMQADKLRTLQMGRARAHPVQ